MLFMLLAVAVVLIVVATTLLLRRGRGGAPPVRPPAEPKTPDTPVATEPVVEMPAPERAGLRDRLGKTRAALAGYVRDLRGRSRLDDETWDDLEELLILADVGMTAATELVERVRERTVEEKTTEPARALEMLREELVRRLGAGDRRLATREDGPTVWLFVGVNGVGKTTTIAKLAQREIAEGHTVLMAAADTFRAAAGDQLATWAERTGAGIVRSQEGADPGSVVYDAMSSAANKGTDRVLVDTAGRLHTKVNLMEELKKLRRIIDKTPGALREVLLVIDATTGQNGLTQARVFADAVDVTGVVLTKLDGTAKGGIVVAIQGELGLPVKLVGVGESAADLIPFDPDEFADALLT
ncbi:MAG: signal recognition particle-docking protein FtsY [Acidimicrobiia bacterium]